SRPRGLPSAARRCARNAWRGSPPRPPARLSDLPAPLQGERQRERDERQGHERREIPDREPPSVEQRALHRVYAVGRGQDVGVGAGRTAYHVEREEEPGEEDAPDEDEHRDL